MRPILKNYVLKSAIFLYFRFLGVKKNGRNKGAVVELKEAIYNEATKLKLPIYLETSEQKNQRVYQRYGFQNYHTWDNKEEGIKIWCMRNQLFVKL